MSLVSKNQKKLKKLLVLKFLTIIFCSQMTTKKESNYEIPDELNTPEKFLDEFRALMPISPPALNINTKYHKNRHFDLNSGITIYEKFEIIKRKLRKEHYKRGPEWERQSDVYPQGVIYEFIYPHAELGINIYIKLKTTMPTPNPVTWSHFVMSFHD